jgi:B-cell receptor-associated protein 31
MINLLFALILLEMALIIIFVFKTPLRKLVIIGLNRVKRGSGPTIVKTVAGTAFVLMLSSVRNVVLIQNRWIQEDADVNPTDQILLANHLLQASLLGFLLFLALMIDRLHHYIRELYIRRKAIETIKKQNRIFEDGKVGGIEELKALEEQRNTLRAKVKHLESQLAEKTKEATTAEAAATAFRNQSEGFLFEYDRLLEDNQILRNHLESVDKR